MPSFRFVHSQSVWIRYVPVCRENNAALLSRLFSITRSRPNKAFLPYGASVLE